MRALPREDRDLFIAANNGHVLSFDNVSGLQNWISDTLCRLSTGGGFAVRQLYTDQDEVLFEAQRPIVMNGIEDVVTRPDLADRSIFLRLMPIEEDKRRAEADIMGDLRAKRPAILGALLDVMVRGLKALPSTKLNSLPRMADFALWATACESALWPDGTFAEAYAANLAGATETIIESDLVASMICEFMRTEGDVVTIEAHKLLDALNVLVSDAVRREKFWPKTPRSLSGKMMRMAPALRKIGIEISREARTNHSLPSARKEGDSTVTTVTTVTIGRKPGFFP